MVALLGRQVKASYWETLGPVSVSSVEANPSERRRHE
jgi:hypothetical protein